MDVDEPETGDQAGEATKGDDDDDITEEFDDLTFDELKSLLDNFKVRVCFNFAVGKAFNIFIPCPGFVQDGAERSRPVHETARKEGSGQGEAVEGREGTGRRGLGRKEGKRNDNHWRKIWRSRGTKASSGTHERRSAAG